MASQCIKDVASVCKKLKSNILDDLDNDISHTIDEIDELTSKAFKEVAEGRGVSENTVRDACTRKIGMNAEELYDTIKQDIANGSRLLENQMISQKTYKDSSAEIKQLMKNVF